MEVGADIPGEHEHIRRKLSRTISDEAHDLHVVLDVEVTRKNQAQGWLVQGVAGAGVGRMPGARAGFARARA